MPETMQAALVRRFGRPLTIERVPVPTPGPGEVLVRVMACGVCHTDLHAAQADWPVRPALPFIPGHEAAGTVAALGPGVTGLAVRDRVGVPWLHDACGACEYCETGWESLCERQRITGHGVDGGFAEYMIASAPFVGRLPDQVDFAEIAPILCAGVTAYKGLKETEARPGEWVAISGVGGLGHLAIQYARAMGLRVAAIDVSAGKLQLARDLGAEIAVYAKSPHAVDQVREATGGGAHGVLVTAVAYSAFEQAIDLVRRRGTISLVGLPPGDFAVPVFDVVLKRITLRGSVGGNRQDLREALAFAAEGKVRARIHRAPLSDINEVLDLLREGKIEGRAVLDLSSGDGAAQSAETSATA